MNGETAFRFGSGGRREPGRRPTSRFIALQRWVGPYGWPYGVPEGRREPPGGHPTATWSEIRRKIQKIEARASRGLEDMEVQNMAARLNVELIRQKFAEGRTATEIATELNCSRSAVARYRPTNSVESDGAAPTLAAPVNGSSQFETAELERLLMLRWQRVPLLEKVKILLERV